MNATRAALLLALALMLAACGATSTGTARPSAPAATAPPSAMAPRTATGVVIAVDQESLTDIRGFALRTDTGTELTFSIGVLDLSEGTFPANHLREHMATASPVTVVFVTQGDNLVAVRLGDAR